MKINWKLRASSASFWVGLVGIMVLVGQAIATQFGYNFDFAGIGKQLTAIINAVFAILGILGVSVDPTTPGVGDSNLVLSRSVKSVVNQAMQVPAANPQGPAVKDTLDEVHPKDVAEGTNKVSTTTLEPIKGTSEIPGENHGN